MTTNISRIRIRALAVGIAGCLMSVPVVSSAMLSPSNADFTSDEWSVLKDREVPVAGVRSGYRVLSISPVCGIEGGVEYSVTFSVNLGNFYSVFMTRQFIPGLHEGLVSSDLRVDDGGAVLLDNLTADWDAGLLRLSGTMSGVTHKDAMERGIDVFADIKYEGTTLITQGFSLRGSSDALASLACR